LWEAHRLQPHRIRTFKRSNDPHFVEKVENIVGLYMDPPKQAVVVSIDKKSQIQALDRTQPGLPLKPGKCGTMTHVYKRNGTTTLFAALNLLDGTVIGRGMRRHRHQEFIRFLSTVERAVPAGKVVHAIVDNYAAHKQPKVLIIPAGRSISRRHRPPGSTPSRASSPPSRAAASDAEPSISSTICRTRSHARSTPTTAIVDRSYGPLPPKRSSKNSPRSLYLLSESVH
jgi:hypothetical protein